jgi:hypothetical protein
MPKTTTRTSVPERKRNIPGPAKAPPAKAPPAKAPPAKAPPAKAQVTALKQNIPAPSVPVQQAPSMFDTMKQGFSFGVGSSIAHNLFGNKNKDEVVNKKETPVEPKLQADKIYELYAICLDKNDNTDCSKILEQANNI